MPDAQERAGLCTMPLNTMRELPSILIAPSDGKQATFDAVMPRFTRPRRNGRRERVYFTISPHFKLSPPRPRSALTTVT